MPDTANPTLARLALRRLARALLERDAGDPPFDGDVTDWLTPDERADYGQVLAALEQTAPRFVAFLLPEGLSCVIEQVLTPHESPAAKLIAASGDMARAHRLARVLNAGEETWDAWEPDEEPFG